MTGMTPERLDAIRANLPTPDADLSRRERDAHDLLDEVDGRFFARRASRPGRRRLQA